MFHSNYVHILHRLCDIAKYWSKIANLNLLPPQFGTPYGVTPLEFRRLPRLSYGAICMILCSAGL